MRTHCGKILVVILCTFCLLFSFSSPVIADPLSDDTEFVSQVYRDFLNREPDPSGMRFWVEQLEVGTLDSAELVEQYMLSAEFGQTVAPVTRLYFAYFNRIPDFSGLMYWIDSYKQGTPLIGISDAFAGSAEFTATYGSLSNSNFVTLVYQNVLGRDPDQGGLDYWAGMLDSSTQTRGQVMVGFSESGEYKDLMANQIYVTMTYIGLLRRSPDQGGFDYWVGIIDQGATGLSLIDSFLYSTEYQGRFDGTWVISSLTISGPSSINENSSTNYVAIATWEDGRTSLVGVTWGENSANASVTSLGVLTIGEISADENISLLAIYQTTQFSESDTLTVSISSGARTIPAAYVQWRTYEDSSRDRLAGWVSLPRGMLYEEATSLALKNSLGGTIATLGNFNQDAYYTYYVLDCTSGICISSSFMDGGWYNSTMPTISAGVYTYTLETTQGEIMSKVVNYLGEVRLPPIPSVTVMSSWNADGSLTVDWENPVSDSDWDTVEMIRLFLYGANPDITYMVKMSPTVQSFTISASELARAFTENELDSLRINMQTRAYEDEYHTNYARASSNFILVE